MDPPESDDLLQRKPAPLPHLGQGHPQGKHRRDRLPSRGLGTIPGADRRNHLNRHVAEPGLTLEPALATRRGRLLHLPPRQLPQTLLHRASDPPVRSFTPP